MNIKDRILEAEISLAKGWYRERSKEEMRAGFRRLSSLIKKRSPVFVEELERLRGLRND